MNRFSTASGPVFLILACAALAPAKLRAQPFEPTGMPPGAQPPHSHNSTGFPAPNTTPGQPIETRAPELSTDQPSFPGQTRAPYRATVPYSVTILTDKLKSPWSPCWSICTPGCAT